MFMRKNLSMKLQSDSLPPRSSSPECTGRQSFSYPTAKFEHLSDLQGYTEYDMDKFYRYSELPFHNTAPRLFPQNYEVHVCVFSLFFAVSMPLSTTAQFLIMCCQQPPRELFALG